MTRGEFLEVSRACSRKNRIEALKTQEKAHEQEQEKERLVAEGKMRKVICHPDDKTTIIRYVKI